MTLTELKYIVAVAREKHFGHAADACYVSQPTLSVAIKKLEEELDVKLFERRAGEVTVKFSCSISGIWGDRLMAWRTMSSPSGVTVTSPALRSNSFTSSSSSSFLIATESVGCDT